MTEKKHLSSTAGLKLLHPIVVLRYRVARLHLLFLATRVHGGVKTKEAARFLDLFAVAYRLCLRFENSSGPNETRT